MLDIILHNMKGIEIPEHSYKQV